MNAHSDTGTVIEADTLAVTVGPDGECALLLPEDQDLPEAAMALVAVFMRLESDPEFIAEQLEWLSARSN